MTTTKKDLAWPACKWTTATVDTATVALLASELSIAMSVAKCLVSRGITTSLEAKTFLSPKLGHCLLPDQMPGIAQAAGIICKHVAAKNKIVVFGDYDADGITASAALIRAISGIGGSVSVFIPDRQNEGYGFTLNALRRCLEEMGIVDLIVTVDCGISQSEACREATSRGVEVVITDHHSITEEIPETASAIVNPELPGTPKQLRHLCGAGVAFKLAHQLAKLALSPEDGRRLLHSILPIIAIGTVGDLVPLTGENRIIVSKGLEIMNRGDCDGNEGIRALKNMAGINRPATASDLGFALAPRINAAGRVGKPSTAIALLSATTSSEATKNAAILEENNLRRRDEETQALAEASALVSDALKTHAHSIVLFNSTWHPGVVGLVASRLVSAYGLPTVIITNGEDGIARGSARCPEHKDLDLMPILESCAQLLERYGGHRVAAGVSLCVTNIERFQEQFDGSCAKATEGLDLRTELLIDDWLQPSEICASLEASLHLLEPCGMENCVPKLGVKGITLKSDPTCFGKTNNHWELAFKEIKHRCIAFRHESMPFKAGDVLDLIFTLSSSVYDPVQLILKDAARSV